MKKTVKLCALLLILVLLPSMFLGSCGIFEQYEFESMGMNSLTYNKPPMGVRVKKNIFDKDCVTVELCYAFYEKNGKGIYDSVESYNKEAGDILYPEGFHKPFYVIYIAELDLEGTWSSYLSPEKKYTDYKNIEGYTYLKTITNEEILSGKYSYDAIDIFGKDFSFLFGFNYDYTEMVQIPREFFDDNDSGIVITAIPFFESVDVHGEYCCGHRPSLSTIFYFENIGDEMIRLTD